MNCVPPRVTSDPSVPPQHVIVPPLVTLSSTFPPELPSAIGVVCCVCTPGGGVTVTVDEAKADVFACDTAVTVTVVAWLAPLTDFTGTECGAVYKPPAEMVPVVPLPPATVMAP